MPKNQRQKDWRRVQACVVMAGWLTGMAMSAPAASLVDDFADRESVTGVAGVVTGSNAEATREPGEPRHGEKRGGRSVWLEWESPASGQWRLSTAGSSFDSLLSVYRIKSESSGEIGFESLERVGDSDDDEEEGEGEIPRGASVLRVGVEAGRRYAIAVDGYAGAGGEVRLEWSLLARESPVPVVTTLSGDRSVRVGDSVTLAVDVQAADDVEYRWYLNGREVDDAEASVLTISRFSGRDVGHYRLRIKVGDLVAYSDTIELQINTEGESATLARDKLFDAVDSSLRSEREEREGGSLALAGVRSSPTLMLPIGVVRGQNGTQVFDTTWATRDAGEPVHCGVIAGGASYWFAYECVVDGRLHFDSVGSDFAAVLAAYTFEGLLEQYDQLVPVGCGIAPGGGGGDAVVEFPAQAGRTYLVAMDGVGGIRGKASLNYRWSPPETTGVPPRVVQAPESRTVAPGQSTTFVPVVEGTPPLSFRWLKDGVVIPGAVTATLEIPVVGAADVGLYQVEVTNPAGVAVSTEARLEVGSWPVLLADLVDQTVAVGDVVRWEARVDGGAPMRIQWFKDGQAWEGGNGAVLELGAVQPADAGRYHFQAENGVGFVVSPPALLRVVTPPVVYAEPQSQQVVAGGRAQFHVEASVGEGGQITWFRDGVPLSGVSGPDLIIDPCLPVHAGEYGAELGNLAGSIRTAAARLTVVGGAGLARSTVPGQLELVLPAGPGQAYRLEAGYDLEGIWLSLEEGIADASGLVIRRVPLRRGNPRFFYRLIRLPLSALGGTAAGAAAVMVP